MSFHVEMTDLSARRPDPRFTLRGPRLIGHGVFPWN